MDSFIIYKDDFAEISEIISRVNYCLRNQLGFSLVRVGDAENQVMAQGTIIAEDEIAEIWWAEDENWTGVTLPNYTARDRLLDAVQKADIVGVLHQDEVFIWKPLTEAVFSHYNIKPRQLCYAFINTYLPKSEQFISLLEHYRLLLIGKAASSLALLLQEKYGIEVAGTIPISNYSELEWVIEESSQLDFDLALISAGSNAVILAVELAAQGKVAIDLGRGMHLEFWE